MDLQFLFLYNNGCQERKPETIMWMVEYQIQSGPQV